MRTTGTADDWYREREAWSAELAALREVARASGLEECVKWGQPAYTDEGATVFLISSMKAGATVNFFKGSLLEDPEGQLVSPGENTRHGRYLQFTGLDDIAARRPYLEGMIGRAIEAERKGLKVEALKPEDHAYCAELQERMAQDEAFRLAFEGLTPGRRRAYDLHFAKPRNASTRVGRIDKCTERILAGVGLMDCVCGHSKRKPRCDGSHKHYA